MNSSQFVHLSPIKTNFDANLFHKFAVEISTKFKKCMPLSILKYRKYCIAAESCCRDRVHSQQAVAAGAAAAPAAALAGRRTDGPGRLQHGGSSKYGTIVISSQQRNAARPRLLSSVAASARVRRGHGVPPPGPAVHLRRWHPSLSSWPPGGLP